MAVRAHTPTPSQRTLARVYASTPPHTHMHAPKSTHTRRACLHCAHRRTQLDVLEVVSLRDCNPIAVGVAPRQTGVTNARAGLERASPLTRCSSRSSFACTNSSSPPPPPPLLLPLPPPQAIACTSALQPSSPPTHTGRGGASPWVRSPCLPPPTRPRRSVSAGGTGGLPAESARCSGRAAACALSLLPMIVLPTTLARCSE